MANPPPTGTTQNAGQPADGKKQLKVALLTPGPVNDNGWSSMAYTGLQSIKTELGAEVNNQEAKDAQIKDAFRSYAQKGYNLIFGHGFEYYAPAAEVAKDFPRRSSSPAPAGAPLRITSALSGSISNRASTSAAIWPLRCRRPARSR